MTKPISRNFEDAAIYSSATKTAISVRDGVIEYLGAELGLEPIDKVFTVYRSPATIANAAYCMPGIPLTDEHVSLDGDASDTGSTVSESIVIDMIDECTSSRIGVQNKLQLSDAALATLQDKQQLSLGYRADLIPHSKWDFEQVNIIPHHLAAVPVGRCGPLCCFLDRKPQTEQESAMKSKLHKVFQDAEGAVNLEQIVDIATSLPDAIRKVPVDKLQKLIPAMQEIMSYAKEQGVMQEEESDPEMTDEEKPKMTDEENPEADEEEKPKFSDADMKKAMSKFADAEVKKYSQVVTKARNFLDEDYDFAGKTANQVMRDSLATQSTDSFADEELSIAFKMLRKSETDYSKFGDSKADSGLAARIKKNMEA